MFCQEILLNRKSEKGQFPSVPLLLALVKVSAAVVVTVKLGLQLPHVRLELVDAGILSLALLTVGADVGVA